MPVPTCIQSSQIDDQISACYIKSKQTKPTNHSSEVCLFVFVCLFVCWRMIAFVGICFVFGFV